MKAQKQKLMHLQKPILKVCTKHTYIYGSVCVCMVQQLGGIIKLSFAFVRAS
jgi:hypothetical protein